MGDIAEKIIENFPVVCVDQKMDRSLGKYEYDR
jgi:hypothetical protein